MEISSEMLKKLEEREMWFFRSILRMSWMEKKANVEICPVVYIRLGVKELEL